MNIEQAKEIIKREDLNGDNFFSTKYIHADTVAIERKANNKYVVFTTNEKMGIRGEHEFANESDALNEYIKRLRALKGWNEFLKEKR